MISRSIRRLVLPVFQRVNPGDITIRHHWTGDSLRLHSFKHKGYWWYRKGRERESMELFRRLVVPGTTVLDIGGHIGYMAQYFSALAGPEGKVFTFEPSPENLPYIRRNAGAAKLLNIEIVEAAAGANDGVAPFFYESVTGQNSTVATDFEGFAINARYNGLAFEYQTCSVPVRSIDAFLSETQAEAGFVKIDAEGGELGILKGMKRTLAGRVRLMVEVNTHHAEIRELLANTGYRFFDPAQEEIAAERGGFAGNVFAVHRDDRSGLEVLEGGRWNG
jgi:FkbM family methyltransferase